MHWGLTPESYVESRRPQPAVLAHGILAGHGVPGLADSVLDGPAERPGGGDRGHDLDRAFGDAAEDRALDAAVAVAPVDRRADQRAQKIAHRKLLSPRKARSDAGGSPISR